VEDEIDEEEEEGVSPNEPVTIDQVPLDSRAEAARSGNEIAQVTSSSAALPFHRRLCVALFMGNASDSDRVTLWALLTSL
jgi:hypothetical protein